MRVNFNLKNEKYKELKIFAIKNNFASLTALLTHWIDLALEMQREKEKTDGLMR